MEDPDDDLLVAPEKPDWRREGKGVWAVRLSNGNYATVTYNDPLENWRAEVLRDNKTRSKVLKNFNRCVAWAERELFPRRTAWDRIKSV